MPGGPLEVGYGVSYLPIAIPVPSLPYHHPEVRRAYLEKRGASRFALCFIHY